MEREKFSSRLGFILISAGCAIGLGNVWRFPYIVGQYGGAAFVLVYLFFLVIMGLPIMVMEFSVGRASQKSILCSFQDLEPKGTKWHWYGWFGMAGNYLLMMYYTTIAGWLILYFIKMLKGDFVGLDTAGVGAEFGAVTADPVIQTIFVAVVVVLGMLVCSRGLKNGVEKINKAMMPCRLVLLVVLAILRPLGSWQWEGLTLPTFQETEEMTQQYREEQTAALSAIIAEKTAAYIWDKAEELGLSCTVEVTVAAGENGIPLPDTVIITGPYDPGLSALIEKEVGIPAGKQIWENIGSGKNESG